MQIWTPFGSSSRREFKVRVVSMAAGNEASSYIPKAPIVLPEGPWKQVISLELLFDHKTCFFSTFFF